MIYVPPQSILAIDPGENFGVALFYNHKLVFSCGASITDPEAHYEIKGVIQKFGVTEKVVERGGWRSQMNAYGIGRHLGIFLGLHHLIYGNLNTMTPTEWKKITCGSGAASKDQVMTSVQSLYKLPVIGQDRADAIGIGHAWINRHEKL